MKAKFNKGLFVTEPITLKFVVSMDNARQTKEDFSLFIGLINRQNNQRKKIDKLEIILSSYLQRFYCGEEPAKKLGEQWKVDNKEHLSDLNKDIGVEIIEWKTLFEEPAFTEAKQKVDALYAKDEAFITIVNNLAKSHAHKADHESAKNYLLEECAVFLNLKGHVAYPATNMNDAVVYVLKQFSSDLIFHGYGFPKPREKLPTKENSSTEIKVFNSCLKTTTLLNKYGVIGVQNQARFFKDFLALEKNSNPEVGENTSVKDQDKESQKKMY